MTKPIRTGTEKQLFLDGKWFFSCHGVKLSVNPPIKADMVLQPEKPWEGNISPYSNIIEDNGTYKLWYLTSHRRTGDNFGDSGCACYAESTDGIHWHRPPLGLFPFENIKETNIVMPGCSPFVMIDPNGPDEARYKALATVKETDRWPETAGCISGSYSYLSDRREWVPRDRSEGGQGFKELYLCTSPDGIHWKIHRPSALPFYHDSHNQMTYDPKLGLYVAYVRWTKASPYRRTVVRTAFKNPLDLPWPYRNDIEMIHGPGTSRKSKGQDALPVVLSRDKIDPPDTDLYTPGVHQYPWAADAYLAFTTPYRHYPVADTADTTLIGKDERGRYQNDGPIEVQLAVSRDGVNFTRPDRKPYIGLGLTGNHDGGQVYGVHGMIKRGDEIWQYYVGTPQTHGVPATPQTHGIRRVVQRLDGFVSADAGWAGAEFITPLLTFDGGILCLNADCSAMGEIRVEIRDDWNHPIAGYSMEEAISIDRNHTAAPVKWKNKEDVRELIGRPVRMRIKMRSCKLYAFQFRQS